MGKSMTKSQIADHLAKKASITKKTATQILDDLAALAHKEAKNSFVVPGVGKLVCIFAIPYHQTDRRRFLVVWTLVPVCTQLSFCFIRIQ